ncbi:MAG TPA: ABC transporter ATP-binding protein [Mycobacteriales bacterium]|nr:ABC transporter ATP-binding protein [Mycobacteriales bacterium]
MRNALRSYRSLMAIGFRAAPKHATGQMLLGILLALAAPAGAYTAKLLVDAAITHDSAKAYTAGFLAAGIAAGILVVAIYYCDCVFGVFERAQAFADRRLMRLIGGVDGLAHHERPEYLDQLGRLRERRGELSGMVNSSTGLLRVLVSLGATATLLAQVNPILLILPVAGLVSFFAGKRTRDLQVAAENETSESERLRRHLFDVGTSASAGKELRIFGLADELLGRHRRASDTVISRINRAEWKGAALQGIDALISGAAQIGAIAVVLVSAVHGHATPGDVVLTITLSATLSGLVFTAVMYGTAFLRVLSVAERFRWLEDYARRAQVLPSDPAPTPDRLHTGIELRNVSFTYPGTDRPVLQDVSLNLPAGSVVAVVGDNGAGKTTLMKLLGRFYDVDGGEILIDGVNVQRFDIGQWRARVSGAFQDHAAFEFLTREAVGVGDLERIGDAAAIQVALERGGGTDVLPILPGGLDTQLGKAWKDGVDLSGGQWQKLALSRGFMRDGPLVMVFDEPTAALDAHTEHALFERFAAAARAGQTEGTVTLLVSHRFSTVRMADIILVLDGGRIVEQGDHAALMRQRGLYAELYQLQSRAYR